MRLSALARRPMGVARVALAFVAALGAALPALATVEIKNRTVNEPLVLDQPEDYLLHKVYISGITDLAALTLTGKINSVTMTQCVFSNIWAGMAGKAVCTEAQGAIVGSFTATDSAFEDAQHQLLCLREGAFGTVTFTRCKFRTSDQFLKRIYTEDPWRSTPPTTEFANIQRLELIDNEFTNTVLVIHPSVKLVIFRGDLSNVRLQSLGTHVIRLERGQDPSTIAMDGTANASAAEGVWVLPMRAEIYEAAEHGAAAAAPAADTAVASRVDGEPQDEATSASETPAAGEPGDEKTVPSINAFQAGAAYLLNLVVGQ